MSPLPEASLHAVLPCDLTSAGRARRILARQCRAAGVCGDAADTAELLVSEVVANAVLHGRSEVRLSVRADAHCVRVSVGDDNSRHPRVRERDPGALDGRGLAIVDCAATRWGVDDDDLGKVVWFELAV
jgi:anti-sigma regulatory factor (Ser/Thr protein kinase)